MPTFYLPALRIDFSGLRVGAVSLQPAPSHGLVCFVFSVESYRNRALVFGLLLLLLLTAFPVANWRPMLFFAHIGAVLLWQPIVSHRKSLNLWQMAMIAGPGALVAVYLSAWPLLAWATLLTGLVAGRIV